MTTTMMQKEDQILQILFEVIEIRFDEEIFDQKSDPENITVVDIKKQVVENSV